MLKRVAVCFLSVLMVLTLCGCWNYRGLDELDIVVGMSIDYVKEKGQFEVCYEVADTAGVQKEEGNIKGKIVEAKGNTLFDAGRNAKLIEANRLFLGSAYIVIISKEVAKEIGLSRVLEWFLRDAECRETMYVAISKEDTAKEILECGESEQGITSVNIQEIIAEDNKITSGTINYKLYDIFNMIHPPRSAAIMPVLSTEKRNGKKVCKLDGTAICKGDKLVGFLSPDESKYALMVENRLTGGIITLSTTGMQPDDISLEIFGSKTKRSFKYENGKLKVFIKITADVALAENQLEWDVQNEDFVNRIKKAAEKIIEKNTGEMLNKVQKEMRADAFGFNEMLYKKDTHLWNKLNPHWEEIYPDIEFKISSTVNIKYSGFLDRRVK